MSFKNLPAAWRRQPFYMLSDRARLRILDDYFVLADDERITFNTVADTWLRTLLPGSTATIAISSV